MDLTQIPGLGPKRIQKLNQAGFFSIQDLLYHIPRTWLDQTKIHSIKELKAQDKAIVIGHIVRAGIIRRRSSFFQAVLADDSGQITLMFFKNPSYWSKKIMPGMRFVAIGTVSEYRGLQLVHPELQPMEDDADFKGGIVPVYSIPEVCREARMEQRFFIKLYKYLFTLPHLSVSKACPDELCTFLGLVPTIENLKRLHQPKSFGEAMQGRRQLKILELLPFCLRMASRRRHLTLRGSERAIDQGLVMAAEASLPYELTNDQKKALAQILEGLHGKRQFHALLQGDVGSGKTVVALLAMLSVCGVQEQCALMVPTDILARQHYTFLKPYFEKAGLRLSLLVGATSAAERKTILGELQMGLSHAVVGTHALFSKDVFFNKLGFVIIDEQHRFGVNQREALLAKGNYPDLLVMSATPIPRSLAMTFYGDLQTILIKEKPPGRKPVKTRLITPEKRDDMKNFIFQETLKGNHCYWVVNRVENDEEGKSLSVHNVFEELRSWNKDWKIEVIHGQMDEDLRNQILKDFNAGLIHVLIATTVIEVGVNVPSANLMVIDHPERLGLSQLHQLRGRVGRGGDQAWCFLMCDSNNPAIERLNGFASTEDGFEIAEMDLRDRGAGNLEGNEQSGSWLFRFFDWVEDQNLIQKILEWAEQILDNQNQFDPVVIEKIQQWYSELPQGNEDGIH